MKRKAITQIRAAALVAVSSLVLLAAVSAAGTAQAAPLDPQPGSRSISHSGVRVNFWQGISLTDGAQVTPTTSVQGTERRRAAKQRGRAV